MNTPYDAGVAFAPESLLLPAPATRPAPERRAASLEHGVLIVDDDYQSAWCLAALIESELGCPVRTATDGAEALDAAIDMHPDAIVMDLDMPGVGGLEAAQLLHSLLKRESPTLIALTGMADPAHRALTRAAGFRAHLAKPVDVNALLALLSEEREG